jgi:RNA polymerase sigma-70 factor (ECF subfamily)
VRQGGASTFFDSNAASGSERHDRDLVERAKAGDPQSLGLLFDNFYPRVFAYLRHRVARIEDAEDLAQECLLRVFRGLDRYEQREVAFGAWVFRIAQNLLTDHYRRHGASPVAGGAASIDDAEIELADERPGGDPADAVQLQFEMQEVIRAMERLTELEREVVRLRFLAELSIAETAATLGKRENNIKQLQHKAITKLRKALSTS